MSIDWDSEYNLSNTNYVQEITKIDFFRIKWDKSYKDVLSFNSLSNQTTFFNNNVLKSITNFNYVKKDMYFDIKDNVANYETFNYLRYQNANYNNKYFYCFIDKVEYISKNITRIYFITDVWQTWFFNLTFYQSFIERSHISKSDDVIGANMQPEPIGSDPEIQTNIDFFNALDWNIHWCLEALSVPPGWITEGKFTYGGVGTTQSDYCSTYIIPVQTQSNINISQMVANLISNYQPTQGQTSDHRQDIIAIKGLPNWCIDALGRTVNGNCLLNSEVIVNDTVTINKTTLNNDYTPRNKKLLTSLYTFYTIYNLNGLKIILKPELISGNQITFVMRCKPCVSETINITINNYLDYIGGFQRISYRGQMQVAFNENSGIQKALNVLNGANGLVNSAIGLGGSIATGNVLGAIGAGSNLINSGIQTIASANNQITNTVGQCVDPFDISPLNIKPRLIQSCPTGSEARRIDKFFDVFGYAQNVYGDISSFMGNRTNWNYIKTIDAKIQLNGNQDDLITIKSIFDNGVTIWHNYNTFGDYSQNND